MQSETEKDLRQFIRDSFLFGDQCQLAADESLVDRGIIDSTGVLELVLFLEEKYAIKIDDNELVPENLDSIASIVRFVDSKIHAGTKTSQTAANVSGSEQHVAY